MAMVTLPIRQRVDDFIRWVFACVKDTKCFYMPAYHWGAMVFLVVGVVEWCEFGFFFCSIHFSRNERRESQTNPKLISFYGSYSYCFSNSVCKLKSFSLWPLFGQSSSCALALITKWGRGFYQINFQLLGCIILRGSYYSGGKRLMKKNSWYSNLQSLDMFNSWNNIFAAQNGSSF